ncbi:MAG: class II aldolase/adducin family protein [bacterium]|nr:class II aldolase/adducin family protein [bacterium]
MRFDMMPPRTQLAQLMARIYRYGMTTTSGGNISLLDDDGAVWITPAGVDKGSLRESDIVCIQPDGHIVGAYKPSSEYPFHLAIYRRRPDARAVLHAHPPALVACSIVRCLPCTHIIPQVEYVCGPVGYAPYAQPGTNELGEVIAEAFARGHHAVVLENHGVVTVGANATQAFMRFETLDYCARIEQKARALGGVRALTPAQVQQLHTTSHFLPEFDPRGHSSHEKEMRAHLCTFIHRAYDQELITSTGGTFSVRLDSSRFLITPNGLDRKYLEPEDLVLIQDGQRERGKIPSRAVRVHEQLYASHPTINAIIIAHPVNIMAFAVSGTPFDTRVIPESYVVLHDVPVVPYGAQFNDAALVVATLSPETPVIIVQNDCVITTGENLLQAYDRLEVAEFTANAIIQARVLGPVQRMSDAQAAALRAVCEK